MKVQNEIEVTYVLYVYIPIILCLLDNIYNTISVPTPGRRSKKSTKYPYKKTSCLLFEKRK